MLAATYDRHLPPPVVLGPDAPVNAGARDRGDLRARNSPTVVRSPLDPEVLAVVDRVDAPRFSCGLHLSRDGGATWSAVPVPAPRGEEPKCYAPDAAFDAAGTLFMTFTTLGGPGNVPHAVWLTRLDRGARDLAEPRRAVGPLAFQVRLAADPRAPGRLYLAWLQAADVALLRFTAPGNPILVARSDDGGRRWSAPVRASSRARQRVLAPALAVAPDGALHLLHLDLGADRLDYDGAHQGRAGPPYPGAWQLVHARADRFGAPWQESVVEPRLVPTRRIVAFIPPLPSLALDPRGRTVHAAFEHGVLGDPDVWVWTSPDRGARWRAPVRVNDTRRRDGTTQQLPRLAVAPTGRLDVVYLDRRRDRRDVLTEVSLQASHDGGRSFTPRAVLTSRAFDARIGFDLGRGLVELGSRLGLISSRGRALAVWPDTRAGTRVSRKQDLASAVAAVPRPRTLAGPVEGALRWAGAALVLVGAGLLVWGSRLRRRHALASGAGRG